MVMSSEEGNFLRGPSTSHDLPPPRLPSSYIPDSAFTLSKAKQYQQQYGDMYFLRLTTLKRSVEAIASAAWDGFQIAGETARKVERVLDVRQGELCWVAGTIYMEMPLKPNILEDISKDHWISAPPPRRKYRSPDGEDSIMLEDESGRLRLTGGVLSKEMLVTGCIVAVMGTENADGEFEVVGIEVPDLPPQDERWGPEGKPDTQKDEEDMEIDDSQPRKKIAIVSGLSFSGTISDHSLEKSLLTEYLLGETSSSAHEITRLIIAGNSISLDQEVLPPLDTSSATTSAARKIQKKYGYDASAYNPAPTAHFDAFLAELLPSLPITLLPGETDPANASFPQQPIHPAMFPQSRAYVTTRPGDDPSSSSDPSWFSTTTNPHSCLLDGWSTLITSGQNVSDVYKYTTSDDRLEIMEALCRWRCMAPTAPDTLWSYPFQDDDPFVMHKCPHIFIVGNQPEFDTAVIEGPEGQTVRLLAVPAFKETGELVLMDVETRECERVRIRVEGVGRAEE